MILAAVDDDDVFDAAADEQLAVTQVSEIAGMQPPVSNRLGSQCLVAEVAQHQRRAASVISPMARSSPLRARARRRCGCRGQVVGRRSSRACAGSAPVPSASVATARSAMSSARRCSRRMIRSTAPRSRRARARQDRSWARSSFRESRHRGTFGKCCQCRSMNRLPATACDAPTRQVHTFEIAIALPDARTSHTRSWARSSRMHDAGRSHATRFQAASRTLAGVSRTIGLGNTIAPRAMPTSPMS